MDTADETMQEHSDAEAAAAADAMAHCDIADASVADDAIDSPKMTTEEDPTEWKAGHSEV